MDRFTVDRSYLDTFSAEVRYFAEIVFSKPWFQNNSLNLFVLNSFSCPPLVLFIMLYLLVHGALSKRSLLLTSLFVSS